MRVTLENFADSGVFDWPTSEERFRAGWQGDLAVNGRHKRLLHQTPFQAIDLA